MTKIIQFENTDGSILEVEVNETTTGVGTAPASRTGQALKLGQQAFEEALSRIRPIADSVMRTARELNNPHEIAVEFGIKVSAASGVVLASAEAEANFKVSLKWKNEPKG